MLWKSAASLRFNDWIGIENPAIIAESEFSKLEISMIEECRKRLFKLWKQHVRGVTPDLIEKPQILMIKDGVRYLKLPMSIVATGEESQGFLGGITGGIIFVENHARGHGIATNMHICIEENQLKLLRPSHFSSGGYASRRSAHKALCIKALKAGDEVPDTAYRCHPCREC